MHTKFKYIHDEVFYNLTAGAWYDFNIRTKAHIIHNYPSIATPLVTDCYDRLDEDKPRVLFKLLSDTGFFNFSGGIPTSLIQNTSQQWDFPNGWAPLQHNIIEGLRKSADPTMQDKAFEIATKWIHGNYKVFNKTKHMYEKYNVIGDVPEPGGKFILLFRLLILMFWAEENITFKPDLAGMFIYTFFTCLITYHKLLSIS